MNIGIVGLGLIGGSMARAYREYSNEMNLGFEIFGADKNRTIIDFARLEGTLDGELDSITLPSCDLVFIALYPVAAIKYLEDNSSLFKSGAVVIDL